MNLLFIDQSTSLGGGQLCLLDVLQGVRSAGWRPTLAAPGDGALLAAAASLGVETCTLHDAENRSVQFVQHSRRQSDQISALLRREQFDLLYVNGARVLPAAARAARRRVPVIFHAHNRPRSPVARALAGWNIRSARATVIACCRFVADVYAAYIEPPNLHVVLNGVREIPYRKRTFSGRLRIGIVGRIEPQKGQLVFAEAARQLTAERADCEFVVCGSPGPSAGSYVESLKEAAAGLPFRFIDWQQNVDSLLDSLDLLVVPSSNEGLPRVILEAFSAGLPVVAFPVGGVPEVICDCKTGYLVRDRTSAGLAKCLRRVIADPNLAAVGSNARTIWEAHHTVDLYRTRIMNLIAAKAAAPVPGGRTAGPQRRTASTQSQ